ncbi:hypothetical protein [Flexithrix dorotheae]|uniref:hypothetical protein n=1 Tax=Flexithrix dorotheae TaxID=70993 RepID=UPI0003769992|nr:hypothetical protein [Flexithrix dorotheae]
MNRTLKQKNWLFSGKIDLGLLFLPVWLTWIVCFSLSQEVLDAKVPLWVWVIFILGIDVGHVWSTIFRTYFDKEEFQNHKPLLIFSPILAFSVLFVIALFSQAWFWRIMAYLALYHFIKQQYGFLALYKARSGDFMPKKIFRDKWVIYFSMIYPVLYWHFSGDRAFNWFIDGDFLLLNSGDFFKKVTSLTNVLYWLILLGWLGEELLNRHQKKEGFFTGKILWMLTTALNWYLGIVYFNSDLAFTLTNVIAHGIPYFTLIFFYVEKKKTLVRPQSANGRLGVLLHVFFMLAVVLFFAMGEEYFWDMLLYREKGVFFESLFPYPVQAFNILWVQAFCLAFLSVPQVAHYIIDGYIWKGNPKNPYLKKVFLNS